MAAVPAEVLRDLRQLGKPPNFEGKDSEWPDFRFSFRVYMTLVSAVAEELLDAAEAAPNQIPVATIVQLGADHVAANKEIYYASALICRGQARTLVRQCEAGHGAEVWRQLTSRYAPETQNRVYSLMMKIITPSSWEKHPDGFEAGLRQWELDIAEFEKASGDILNDMVKYAIMMNQAPKT